MSERRSTVRFEPTDIHARGVLIAAFGVLVATAAIICLLYFLFAHLSRLKAEQSPPPAARSQSLPPEPRLEIYPYRDFKAVRSAAEAELNSYRWVDRQKGVVTIPIDRAIDLIAQRGIPPTPPAPANVYYRPQAGDRMTGFEERKEPQP